MNTKAFDKFLFQNALTKKVVKRPEKPEPEYAYSFHLKGALLDTVFLKGSENRLDIFIQGNGGTPKEAELDYMRKIDSRIIIFRDSHRRGKVHVRVPPLYPEDKNAGTVPHHGV